MRIIFSTYLLLIFKIIIAEKKTITLITAYIILLTKLRIVDINKIYEIDAEVKRKKETTMAVS